MEELQNVVMANPTPKPTGGDPRANEMGMRIDGRVCMHTHTRNRLFSHIYARNNLFRTIPGLRLRHNVCYVVGMVLMHEGKVLLIQEAKASCRGSWYLPAGRVEPNETLEV